MRPFAVGEILYKLATKGNPLPFLRPGLAPPCPLSLAWEGREASSLQSRGHSLQLPAPPLHLCCPPEFSERVQHPGALKNPLNAPAVGLFTAQGRFCLQEANGNSKRSRVSGSSAVLSRNSGERSCRA